mgnify:FL=1
MSTAAQFVNAVFAARASTGPSEIKMVAGTYDLPSTGVFDQANLTITDQTGLSIIGGYAAGCAGGVPASPPSATIIRPAAFDQRLMDIVIVDGDTTVSIQQVSFRRGRSPTVNPACLWVDIQPGVVGRVELINTEFTDCMGPGPGCAVRVEMDDMRLNMSNSIVHGNTCNGGAVLLVPGPNAVLYATNNTIARNVQSGAPAAAGMQIGHSSGPISSIYLINNVIYHNGDPDDFDVRFNTNVPGFARNNIIGRQNAFPAAMVISNNSAVDPQFTSTTNFRPTANSPLVNAGFASAPLGLPLKDLDSNPRPQGGVYDIGAYELPQEGFRNGFE